MFYDFVSQLWHSKSFLFLGGYAYEIGQTSEWPVIPKEMENSKQTTNPFWNQMGKSNPFLNDIVLTSTYDSGVSMLKEDPLSLFDSIQISISLA